jgi:hypothetical protein
VASTPRPVIDRKSVAVGDGPRLGGGDDGPGERVLAVGLDAAGEAQHLVVVDPVGAGDADDGVLALGEGAGLVEQHGVDRAAGLEGEAVLDEDAVAGRDRVDSEVVTSGMARPRAWGQEMTSTVTTRTTPRRRRRAATTPTAVTIAAAVAT